MFSLNFVIMTAREIWGQALSNTPEISQVTCFCVPPTLPHHFSMMLLHLILYMSPTHKLRWSQSRRNDWEYDKHISLIICLANAQVHRCRRFCPFEFSECFSFFYSPPTVSFSYLSFSIYCHTYVSMLYELYQGRSSPSSPISGYSFSADEGSVSHL